MGGQTEWTRQSDEILLPALIGSGTLVGVGAVVALPITGTVLIVDLTSMLQTITIGTQSATPTSKAKEQPNPLGSYLSMISSGLIYFATSNLPGGLTSLSTTATSTVPQSAGATQYQIPSGGTPNVGVPLPGYQRWDFALDKGPSASPTSGTVNSIWGALSSNRYLGAMTATGTATLYLWVSSR